MRGRELFNNDSINVARFRHTSLCEKLSGRHDDILKID